MQNGFLTHLLILQYIPLYIYLMLINYQLVQIRTVRLKNAKTKTVASVFVLFWHMN